MFGLNCDVNNVQPRTKYTKNFNSNLVELGIYNTEKYFNPECFMSYFAPNSFVKSEDVKAIENRQFVICENGIRPVDGFTDTFIWFFQIVVNYFTNNLDMRLIKIANGVIEKCKERSSRSKRDNNDKMSYHIVYDLRSYTSPFIKQPQTVNGIKKPKDLDTETEELCKKDVASLAFACLIIHVAIRSQMLWTNPTGRRQLGDWVNLDMEFSVAKPNF